MSIRFDAVGDRLSRSASGLHSSNFTMCGWVYLDADRDAFTTFFGAEIGSATTYSFIGTNATGTALGWDTSASPISSGVSLAVGVWYFIAATYNTSTVEGPGDDFLYWAATGAGSLSSATWFSVGGIGASTWTFDIGNNSVSEWLNGRMAHVKVWSAALSASEVDAEWHSFTPVQSTNLWAYYPLANATDINDASGAGRHLTAAGTLTTGASDPVLPTPPPPRVFLAPARSTMTLA